MRRSAWTIGATVLAALSLGVAACGGSDIVVGRQQGRQHRYQGARTGQDRRQADGAVDWRRRSHRLRPDLLPDGQLHLQRRRRSSCTPTSRTTATTLVPDLADGDPQVSEDGKTVTVKIKQGVKYSPPYDKEVTSADVKYAIERGFFSSVASGFTQSYYADLEGAKINVKPGTEISGLQTPDRQTLVLKFKRAVGGVMASGALAYGATAPVPKAYAEKFDAKTPSTYGENQLATGPYMIANDASGKAIGYEPGKRIHLVRNPNWDKSLDFKPAYLDEIDNLEGNDDPGVASRRILTGQSMINGDFSPLPENLKDASQNRKDQLVLIPSGGGRWISMNTTIKPFDDINVRKAVIAGMDRDALLLTRGGKLVGDQATHFLPPGMAGLRGGRRHEGHRRRLPVRRRQAAAGAQRQVLQGGGLRLRQVRGHREDPDGRLQRRRRRQDGRGRQGELRADGLQRPDAPGAAADDVHALLQHAVREGRDLPERRLAEGLRRRQTMLDPTFNGKNILEQGNSNWSELDDPTINKAMDKAELLPKEERAGGLGRDRQAGHRPRRLPSRGSGTSSR